MDIVKKVSNKFGMTFEMYFLHQGIEHKFKKKRV